MWGNQMFLLDALQTGIFFMDSRNMLLNLRDIWACFGGRYLQKSYFSVMGFTDRGSIG